MNASSWITETWLRNNSDQTVRLFFDCNIECPPFSLEPGQTIHQPPVFHAVPSGPPTAYVLVEKGAGSKMDVSLRVQDISRQALTWGTEIPVIRETDLRTGALELFDVPIDDRFRSTLRIYNMTDDVPVPYTVSFYRMESTGNEPPLAEVSLQSIPGSLGRAGYAELLTFDQSMPELAGAGRVRVRVSSATPVPFWAMISVTNNETQHVTLITPR